MARRRAKSKPAARRKSRKTPAAVARSVSVPGRMRVVGMGSVVAIDYTAPGMPDTLRHSFTKRPRLYRTSDGMFVVIPLPRKAGKYLEG